LIAALYFSFTFSVIAAADAVVVVVVDQST
jgi:hypothetical protein